MFDRQSFAKRFKKFRMAYGLTLDEFADIFGSLKKGTIGGWETSNNIPSADILYDLSLSFGISMDWFAGISDIPYNENLMKIAEEKLMNEILTYDTSNEHERLLTYEYSIYEKRKKLYSLPVRANIIMLYRSTFLVHYKKSLKLVESPPKKPNFFEQVASNYFKGPKIVGSVQARNLKRYENLVHLCFRHIDTALYDIESDDKN